MIEESEYDPCEDCQIYGDDVYLDEDGNYQYYCDKCTLAPDWWEQKEGGAE